jgi:hypothetical protein
VASFLQCPHGSFDCTASYLTRTNSTTGDVSQAYTLTIDIPPAAITNLAASSPTDTAITLTWTVPGRGGTNGNATGYIVKYSTSGPISDANWDSAATYTQTWTPAKNGTTETRVMSGLTPGTQYWFAIKAYDDASPSNYAGVSNSASGTTTGGGGTGPGIELTTILLVAAVVAAVVVMVVVAVRRRKKKLPWLVKE